MRIVGTKEKGKTRTTPSFAPAMLIVDIVGVVHGFRGLKKLKDSLGWGVSLRSQGPPTEVKIGKSGKSHFGVKECLFWGYPPPSNHLNGLFGAFNSLP